LKKIESYFEYFTKLSTRRYYLPEYIVEDHRKDFFSKLSLLDKDVQKLYNVFKKISKNNETRISSLDILMYLDIERTSFVERVLRRFERAADGRIDFCAFVITIWNFCSLDYNGLIGFMFDLYDDHNTSFLFDDNLRNIMCDVYGPNFAEERKDVVVLLQKMLTMICLKEPPVMIFDEFLVAAEKSGSLMVPATKLQNRMRKKIVGLRFWHQRMTLRKKATQSGEKLDIVTLFRELNKQDSASKEAAALKILETKFSKSLAARSSKEQHQRLQTYLKAQKEEELEEAKKEPDQKKAATTHATSASKHKQADHKDFNSKGARRSVARKDESSSNTFGSLDESTGQKK